jgi:hypothetical protein
MAASIFSSAPGATQHHEWASLNPSLLAEALGM